MHIITFLNELGNKIRIRIKQHRDSGKNAKTNEEIKFTGVNIAIIGPTSVSENIITRDEAVKLHALLGEFLRETA